MKEHGVVDSATVQGPRRFQEDRYFFDRVEHGWLLAVMDGHNGDTAAKLCAERIGDYFREASKLVDPYQVMDHLVSSLRTDTDHCVEGSTLSVAWIREDKDDVVVAVLGDSPVLVIDQAGEVHWGPNHNISTNAKERSAAIERGAGYDERGYIFEPSGRYGLQVSRALGDSLLKEVIVREPEVVIISQPQIVLVATDGLLNPNERHNDFWSVHVTKAIASRETTVRDLLVAAERRLRDNATGILWKK